MRRVTTASRGSPLVRSLGGRSLPLIVSFGLGCLGAAGVERSDSQVARSAERAIRAEKAAREEPDARAHHQVAYHAGDGRVYLIGGSTRRDGGYHYFNDIWRWDEGGWTRRDSLPFSRSSHRIVNHVERNSLMLFGGTDGKAIKAAGVLWEWRAGEWKALTENPEAGRGELGMCYDAKRARVVLFGGWDHAARYTRDTWEWMGDDLVRVDSTGGPAARAGHAFLYDPVHERCLLFGGRGDDGYFADTWGWDGARWQRLDVAGPSARWFFGSATDHANGRIVVFGGAGADGDLDDTWVWDGERWKLLTREGPPSRSMAKLAFDGSGIILFGGRKVVGEGWIDLNDTWRLSAGSWARR